MRTTTLVLTTALLAFACFVHGSSKKLSVYGMESTSFGLTGRIVNGTKAVSKQFPHQVSLRRSWSDRHFCGGSIISTKLVLTAGHCMFLNGIILQPWMLYVVGGNLKLSETSPTRQKSNVDEIRIHPQFDPQTLHNDVAVLELMNPFEFTPELRNVPLAAFDIIPNTLCQVSGWGYPANDINIVSDDLMYVDLPIREIKECRELLVNVTELPDGMFCAGYLEGGRDACQGDSGGGMVCNGILTGVVSGGEGCAVPRLPGVYANVYSYTNWISNGEYIELAFINKPFEQDNGNSGARKTPTIMIVVVSLSFALLSDYIVIAAIRP